MTPNEIWNVENINQPTINQNPENPPTTLDSLSMLSSSENKKPYNYKYIIWIVAWAIFISLSLWLLYVRYMFTEFHKPWFLNFLHRQFTKENIVQDSDYIALETGIGFWNDGFWNNVKESDLWEQISEISTELYQEIESGTWELSQSYKARKKGLLGTNRWLNRLNSYQFNTLVKIHEIQWTNWDNFSVRYSVRGNERDKFTTYYDSLKNPPRWISNTSKYPYLYYTREEAKKAFIEKMSKWEYITDSHLLRRVMEDHNIDRKIYLQQVKDGKIKLSTPSEQDKKAMEIFLQQVKNGKIKFPKKLTIFNLMDAPLELNSSCKNNRHITAYFDLVTWEIFLNSDVCAIMN